MDFNESNESGMSASPVFFLPNQFVDPESLSELMANGKLFCVEMVVSEGDRNSTIDTKYFIPYVPPMGFNTHVLEQTKVSWLKVNNLMNRDRGN